MDKTVWWSYQIAEHTLPCVGSHELSTVINYGCLNHITVECDG
jgi:hypothetical protein